jgi:hypothetical protein
VTPKASRFNNPLSALASVSPLARWLVPMPTAASGHDSDGAERNLWASKSKRLEAERPASIYVARLYKGPEVVRPTPG